MSVWKSDGMSTTRGDNNKYTCTSTHLTNFSLVARPPAPALSAAPSKHLPLPLIIGVAVGGTMSIIIVVVAVVVGTKKVSGKVREISEAL